MPLHLGKSPKNAGNFKSSCRVGAKKGGNSAKRISTRASDHVGVFVSDKGGLTSIVCAGKYFVISNNFTELSK